MSCFECPYGQNVVCAAEDKFIQCETCETAEECRMLLGVVQSLFKVQRLNPHWKAYFEALLEGDRLSPKKLDLSSGPLGILVGDPRMRAGLEAWEAIEAAKDMYRP